MYKILVVAPYEGLANVFRSVRNEYEDVSFEIIVADMSGAMQRVRAMDVQKFDAVISRGGTAQFLKKELDIPVLEIPISIYDMMRVIQLAAGYRQKFAIIGFPFMTTCAKAILDLQNNRQVYVRSIHSEEEAVESLQYFRSEGCTLVVGDNIVINKSIEYGINGILVTSGVESVREAVDSARRICRVIRIKEINNSIFSRLWRNSGAVALVMDESGETVYHNLPEEDYDGIRTRLLQEKQKVLNGTRSTVVIHQHQQQYSFAVFCEKINEQKYLFFCSQKAMPLPAKNDKFIQMKTEVQDLDDTEKGASFNLLVTQSQAGKRLQNSVSLLARQQAPVLIAGEPGLAKIEIVSAIHKGSDYAGSRLYVIDSRNGTIQKWRNLLDHCNSILYQENNAICIHNIQNVPAEIWTDLLQYIQIAQVSRKNKLFFTYSRKNNLQPDNEFASRVDSLLDMLSCVILTIPALRERKEDIVPFATLYISEMNTRLGKQITGFEEEAVLLLQQCEWNENFRQLRKVICEAATMTDGYQITAKTVSSVFESLGIGTMVQVSNMTLDEVIRNHILNVLREEGGNQTRAAQVLGISRGTLWRRLGEYESHF